MATVHDEPGPLQPPPLKPLNVDPLVGVAASVTVVPVAKSAAHVPGQEIPLGLLVTVPFPPRVTVSRSVEIETIKPAVTMALFVMLQGPVPEHAPLQPANAATATAERV